MKKTILAILIGGASMLTINLLTGQVFQLLDPSLRVAYENPALFRPWTDPLMSIFFFVPFVSVIILALIWNKIKPALKTENLSAGINFAILYWLTGVPGMLMTYSSFQVPLILVLSWTLSNLLQAICVGLIFGKLMK